MVKDEAQLLLAHTYTIETIKLLKYFKSQDMNTI